MPEMETRAGTVAFEGRGSGVPVVLLHATLHDRHDFDAIAPALRRDHRVIAVDWPGCGESPAPGSPERLSAPLLADALEDLVEQLELPPAVFIGNSVGGFAAARLAITHPERVAGLVLVNTGGFIPINPLVRGFCRLIGTPAIARRVLPSFVRSYMKPRTELDREIVARVVARAKTREGIEMAAALWRSFSADEHDLRGRAERLRAPTLIVWGEKDTAIPLRASRAAHAAIAGSRLEVIETGHVAFSSAPEEFLALVEPFIQLAAHSAPAAAVASDDGGTSRASGRR